MTPDRNLLCRYTERFAVVVHAENPPSDAEWNALLDEYLTKPGVAHVLVYSAGGAPNAKQRVRLTSVLSLRGGSVAVLTPSKLARAAGMALNLFRPEIRVFAPSELDLAFDYLGANEVERAMLARVLDEVKAELGLPRD
jgi:hypothetical protein